ncbi:hypothetical protein SLS57_007231 [Botryosphaeria dothidea]
MASDLGLHHSDPADPSLKDLNPVDIEAESWSPFCADSVAMTRLAPGEYPTRKGHYVSCFANSCKLSIIINDIIINLYSRRGVLN